jgi:hypothetical protein
MLVNSSQTTFNPAAQTNDLHIHTNHSRAAHWAVMRVLHFHSEETFTSVLAFLERNEMEEHLVKYA